MKKSDAASRLRTARQAAGYDTAKAFAEANAIPQSTYALHESGKRNLSVNAARKYAVLLQVQEDWLLLGSESKPDIDAELLKELVGILLKVQNSHIPGFSEQELIDTIADIFISIVTATDNKNERSHLLQLALTFLRPAEGSMKKKLRA